MAIQKLKSEKRLKEVSDITAAPDLPGSYEAGDIVYDAGTKRLKRASGSAWEDLEVYKARPHTAAAHIFTVTVVTKTAAHRYNGVGSSNGYVIDGEESPYIHLAPGSTYRFDQAHNSNTGHPLRFFTDAGKTNPYTSGVTVNGTPGSSGAYTQFVVPDDAPATLHYQCNTGGHNNMGNAVSTQGTSIEHRVLSDLKNVHDAAPTDGQVLSWDNGNARWAPANAGGGGMTSFTVTGDAGSVNQTIENGNTLTFVGGTGLNIQTSNTDTVTAEMDYSGADSFIMAATNGTGITVDGANDKLLIYDNNDTTVKYINVNQLPSGGGGIQMSEIVNHEYAFPNNSAVDTLHLEAVIGTKKGGTINIDMTHFGANGQADKIGLDMDEIGTAETLKFEIFSNSGSVPIQVYDSGSGAVKGLYGTHGQANKIPSGNGGSTTTNNVELTIGASQYLVLYRSGSNWHYQLRTI